MDWWKFRLTIENVEGRTQPGAHWVISTRRRSLVSMCVEHKWTDWEEALQGLTLAARGAAEERTGFSPSELVLDADPPEHLLKLVDGF